MLTKNDLASALANNHNLTQKDALEVVGALFGAISDELAKGGEVRVHGFGAFQIRERAARDGRNPKTGEAMKIAASKTVGFKPAKGLKDAL